MAFFVPTQDDLETVREESTYRRRYSGMAGPLDGIRVVEISMFQQGPVAGMRWGDLGAEVIKIEAPSGDPARGFMKIIGAMAGLSGNNYFVEVDHPQWGKTKVRDFPGTSVKPLRRGAEGPLT
jgi:crotonobetainyl-CoA:carnitine CoA-transferase CaiB-like acyl-CoA transferase